jgi:hypothetical protein
MFRRLLHRKWLLLGTYSPIIAPVIRRLLHQSELSHPFLSSDRTDRMIPFYLDARSGVTPDQQLVQQVK